MADRDREPLLPGPGDVRRGNFSTTSTSSSSGAGPSASSQQQHGVTLGGMNVSGPNETGFFVQAERGNSSEAGAAGAAGGAAGSGINELSLGSLLSSLRSLQGARIGVQHDSSSQGLSVPRIQLRITSTGGGTSTASLGPAPLPPPGSSTAAFGASNGAVGGANGGGVGGDGGSSSSGSGGGGGSMGSDSGSDFGGGGSGGAPGLSVSFGPAGGAAGPSGSGAVSNSGGGGRPGGAVTQSPSLSRALLRHLSRNGAGGAAGAGPSGGDAPLQQQQQQDGGGGGGGNIAAAAERHRLSNTTVVDLQAAARWLEGSLGFFALLLAVFLYHHASGIATFAWLTAVLVKFNEALRRQVALKEQRRVALLLLVAGGALAHVAGVLYLTREHRLWGLLWFVPPRDVATVWDAFWMVAIVDVLVRFAAMAAKVGVLLASNPTRAEALRRRGGVLTFVEHAVLLYRAALPVPVWYKYYDSRRMPSLLFSLCTGMYVMAKCSALYERLGGALAALRAVLRPEGQYGSYASPEEVAEAGNQCPICQDPMTKPIRLACSHVFCEACIAEWFERARACPMCRADVKPAALPSFGDCSTSLLPQLF